MELGLKVIVKEEEAAKIVKGWQWKPSEDIDKNALRDLDEAKKGRDMLDSLGKVAIRSLVNGIPQGYSGGLEFEFRLRAG